MTSGTGRVRVVTPELNIPALACCIDAGKQGDRSERAELTRHSTRRPDPQLLPTSVFRRVRMRRFWFERATLRPCSDASPCSRASTSCVELAKTGASCLVGYAVAVQRTVKQSSDRAEDRGTAVFKGGTHVDSLGSLCLHQIRIDSQPWIESLPIAKAHLPTILRRHLPLKLRPTA